MLPDSYRPQDGCWNCCYTVLLPDEEEGPCDQYCTYDGSGPRDAVWEEEHYVSGFCICDKHEVINGQAD